MTPTTTTRSLMTTIPVTVTTFGGSPGFASLLVEQLGDEIKLDAQVEGGCLITLTERSAGALFDVLGAMLAGLDHLPDEGVESGDSVLPQPRKSWCTSEADGVVVAPHSSAVAGSR